MLIIWENFWEPVEGIWNQVSSIRYQVSCIECWYRVAGISLSQVHERDNSNTGLANCLALILTYCFLYSVTRYLMPATMIPATTIRLVLHPPPPTLLNPDNHFLSSLHIYNDKLTNFKLSESWLMLTLKSSKNFPERIIVVNLPASEMCLNSAI